MIGTQTVINMINHWLDTPVNSYFGQGYGADLRSMLLQELSSTKADELLIKLRQDIPLLNQFDDSSLSVHSETVGFDTVKVYLSVGSIDIYLGDSTDTINQDYYDTRAQ
ncbi:hypothetical protein [Psychrobacter sp. I-STPA10]|uniref:hypothetical protein n=1 Tax=Psychrobacter sp. I-STPA10 TaxID=2585769 RepID=UPI001E3A6245|nr:hypothetical protein [Psychrobacter sp. I-STPA10]